MNVRVARPESGTKSPIGRAPHQSIAADFSAARVAARARPPVRAADAAAGDRFLLARASAARRSPGAGAGGQERRARDWTWRLADKRKSGLPATFRTPPAPYREAKYARGPGFCCVCGQPVFRFGWHVDLWGGGPNKNATWHCACVIAWQFWNAPSGEAPLLRRLQARRCAQSGGRLMEDRRDRPPGAVVPGVERASRYAVAGAARFLGLAEPAGDQSRRSRGQMRQRGARPQRRAADDDGDYTMISPRLMLAPRLASTVLDRPPAKICTV